MKLNFKNLETRQVKNGNKLYFSCICDFFFFFFASINFKKLYNEKNSFNSSFNAKYGKLC